IFQKDVFSFDYEFHKLNHLLCIGVFWKRSHANKGSFTSIFRLCPIASTSVLALCKPVNPKMIVGDD
ncbi:hypothetical protein, partial [Collinsella aerofaciens]|uniref:hypothetical protein n=1 Tax=Collinsella aerofaciens TaxID=74426 RepID=UPI0035632DC6